MEHSQAGCNQRAGRAGRVKPGTCYRLFTERNFMSRQEFTTPEIQRLTLENALLRILGIGIENLESFPLLDAPDSTVIHQALSKLQRLGAIDSEQKMLPLGKLMARLPLEPELARMLVAGIQSGCVDQVITLAAFISARTVFFRPKEMNRQFEARMKWRQLSDQRSDFLTYLKIWNQYQESEKTEGLTSGQWAFDNYLNAKVLREIADIRRQLIDTVKSLGLPLSSNPDEALIHKCVLAAFSDNLMISLDENYEHFEAGTVYRHKGTATITTFPKIVVATTISKRGHEVRGEQRTYMDHVAPIEANWVQEVCPQLITNLWNWKSLRFNHFENRLEINQNHVFRQRWYIGETAKPVIPELFTQAGDHQQLQIHFLALLLQHASQRLQQDNHLITSFDQERKSLALVSATLARFQINNEDLSKLNMFDQALIQKIMRTLNQRIDEQTSAQWEEEMAEIRELLTECRALITQENLDLVKRHRNPNWRLADLIDLAEEILNATNDGSFMRRPRIKENLRRLKINSPILLNHAQNEMAKEVVAQNLRAQKAKLQTRLMEHIKEEYILCPVCNETINVSATLQGITSCDCRQDQFQEMFACTKQNEVILLQTTGSNQIVAELVAKVTPNGYSHELRIFPQRLTLDIQDFTITHYYEPPSEEQIQQYRNREQIAQYAKEKAKAEKQVRSGHAIVLTFVQRTTARGEPQWEAINGKSLYVVDKNSEIQPSTEQKRFYCTRAKNPFGHKGNLALIMVTPFLPHQ